jgi:hypothetical protein
MDTFEEGGGKKSSPIKLNGSRPPKSWHIVSPFKWIRGILCHGIKKKKASEINLFYGIKIKYNENFKFYAEFKYLMQ